VPIAHAGSVLTLAIIVAYGIATRHILDVGSVIRKMVAYTLLTGYLVIVYLSVWSLGKYVLFAIAPNSAFLAQITAAIAVAFSMAPVHGRFQRVASRLVSSRAMDIPVTMKKAGVIFQSVTTIDALLHQFSDLLMAALDADDMRIFLAEDSSYIQRFPKQSPAAVTTLPKTSVVAEMIRKAKDSVSVDTLIRMRQTSKVAGVLNELNGLNAHVAAGVFGKAGLRGLVLFGSRHGGRIYDKNEQDALQILCNQLAGALENAQLYTEMQDSKIRNEIMLDQLVSGVIVADPERKIRLINHEAQRITGLTEEQALGQGLDLLPESISETLEITLATQCGVQNTNAVLLDHENEESTHVRLGSAYLLGHDKKPMGALLVFTDMTEVKGLEEQVRRADQLSSVGTLAAGMAHEIKNPLVTIKTFTQLLPMRYDDADFRKDFSSLVAHEVSRIDGIVNHLLNFSKPSQPHLVPMKLHETVEKTLKLIHEQLAQKNIVLNNKFEAQLDLISGDADLLTQTLVNFNLNAIEAIESDGTINVTTTNCAYRFAQDDNSNDAVTKSCIRLQISDTGKGIAREQLQKIFDPFFTSKSEGTGMGLSVAHGIIREHHGAIEVDSYPGKGTTFSIYIPVLEEDAAA
jgi:PAS domain S-box-containing protein